MNKKAMSSKVICMVIVGTLISSNVAYAHDLVSKDESVFVNLDYSGSVKEEIVSDWLHSTGALTGIEDVSDLSNLKNIKGDEKPKVDGNKLNWDSSKNDLFYQGTTNKELPIKADIKYYLDGEEVDPDTIAGKSGQITIKIHFTNKESKIVNIKDEDKKIYTPFSTLTVATLPMDTFQNVKVTNGEIISEGNNNIVSFVCFPGLKESLDIGDKDVDLDLPEDFEIKADVTKFKLGPIYITATPDLPDVDTFKAADSIDELKDGIADLKDATNKLCDGSNKLSDGADRLKDGVSQLKDGIDKAKSGVADAKKQMNENSYKLDLIRVNSNVVAERKLLSDAYYVMNMDTSMLQIIKPFGTQDNINLIKKTVKDFKSIDYEALMNDPLLKSLPSMATADNINNVNKLLADYDFISKLDMTQVSPYLTLLNSDSKMASIMGGLQTLKTMNIAAMEKAQTDSITQFVTAQTALNSNADLLKKNADSLPLPDGSNPQYTAAYKLVKGYEGLVSDNTTGNYEALVNATATNLQTQAKNLKPTLDSIQGVQTILSELPELSPEKLQEIKAILNQLVSMKSDLDANKQNIEAIKALIAKLQDPKTQELLPKVKAIETDLTTVKPILDKLSALNTPQNVAKLQAAPAMVDQLTTMQTDLKNDKKILDVVQDSLKENNVKLANDLIKAIPSLTDGVNQLADGADKLFDGATDLSNGARDLKDGMNKFNEEGIKKIDDKASPKIEDVEKLIDTKDQIVKLSKDYGTFTGKADDMNSKVKFIMKTDEVKIPEVKKTVAKVETKKKLTFFQWVKSLF